MYNIPARQEMGRLSHDMHAILDKAKAQGRGLNSDERTKYHAMTDRFSKLELEVLGEKSNAREAFLASPLEDGGGRRAGQISQLALEEFRDTHRVARHDERQRSPHDKAFTKYLRATLDGLDSDERELVLSAGGRFSNTTSTTVTSQGGAIVPQGFSDKLMEQLKWWGGIDSVVGSFTTETGNVLPYPTLDDTSQKGRLIGQNQSVAQTDPVFNQVTFNAYIFSSDITLIPRALVEDSYFDLDALLARMLATRIGRLLNAKCTTGSGTNEPNGIVTAAVAAGNILQFPAGSTTSIAYASMVDLEHSVDPAYRFEPATRFMFHDTTLKGLKKLVDGQSRPLWQPGLTASFGDGAAVGLLASKPTILNHPYIINQDMAPPTASAYSWLFGDMSKYLLRKVGDIQVQRLIERYADYLQIGYIAWLRADGQFVNATSTASLSPIAVGQQSGT